jgi:hypothetical protein
MTRKQKNWGDTQVALNELAVRYGKARAAEMRVYDAQRKIDELGDEDPQRYAWEVRIGNAELRKTQAREALLDAAFAYSKNPVFRKRH